MKRKLIWTLILYVLLFDEVFRPSTVPYMGEDKNWLIRIEGKLVGLNESY